MAVGGLSPFTFRFYCKYFPYIYVCSQAALSNLSGDLESLKHYAAITLPFSQNLKFFLIYDLGLEMDLNFQVIKLEEKVIYYYYYSFAVFLCSDNGIYFLLRSEGHVKICPHFKEFNIFA